MNKCTQCPRCAQTSISSAPSSLSLRSFLSHTAPPYLFGRKGTSVQGVAGELATGESEVKGGVESALLEILGSKDIVGGR